LNLVIFGDYSHGLTRNRERARRSVASAFNYNANRCARQALLRRSTGA
jgi:hypothetical protein